VGFDMRPETRDLTERILYLRSIPVGGALSPRVLQAIASTLRERTFPKGTHLMRENEPIVALHLLTGGSVSLARGGRALGTLRPPQSLGFLGIMAQSDGAYDAICDEDTRTFEVAADALSDLLEDQFEFFYATLRYMADRLYYDMQELPAAALGSEPELDPKMPERPLDLVERIWVMRGYAGFEKANLNALASLCQQCEEVRFEPGTRLWSAGDPAPDVFLLVRGTIGCLTAGGTQFRYGPSTAVGGVDTVADKPRWYSATTETRVLGLRAASDRFVDLLENDFSLASNFLAALAGALVKVLARKAELGHEPLAQRRNVSQLGAVPVGA
jgi:CRP-like cAMP-binding protein